MMLHIWLVLISLMTCCQPDVKPEEDKEVPGVTSAPEIDFSEDFSDVEFP